MHRVAHRLRRDAVHAVVLLLNRAAAVGFADGAHQAVRHHVGVHNHAAVNVSRGAPDGLHERRFRAQEALLVRVENRDERHFRQVQPLAQEVDAHQHVVFAEPQPANQRHAIHRRHVAVQVADADVHALQVLRQALRHPLGERRHQHALLFRHDLVDFSHEVIHLTRRLAEDDFGVKQPGRADNLFHNLGCVADFIRAGRCGDENRLPDALFKLLEQQRTIVKRRRQSETIFDKLVLARAVAVVHGANLRHGDVALVDEAQKALGEVVQQGIGRVAGLSAIEVARIILDAAAIADFTHHLDVVIRPLGDSLRLQQLAFLRELVDLLLQIALNDGDFLRQIRLVSRVVRRRIDACVLQRCQRVSGHDLELADGLDFVAEELNPQAVLLAARGDDFQHVAAHAERPALKLHVVAVILDGNQLADEVVAPNRHARPQRYHLPLVLAGVAHGIDAADRRDDNHVPPLPKCRRRAVAEAVDFLVDGGILLDVGVRRRDIRFRLIVIIIGNEIFHRAVGEECPKLRAELRRQRFVVRNHQRRALHLRNNARHRERFARPGYAQQHLPLHARVDTLCQRLNRLRLISAWLIRGFQHELPARLVHPSILPCLFV